MNAIKATVKGGRLEVQVPPDWPDGTEVILQPVRHENGVGIREEDWPDTPEAIAEWLTWYDSLEPLIFTDEERAALEADRAEKGDAARSLTPLFLPVLSIPAVRPYNAASSLTTCGSRFRPEDGRVKPHSYQEVSPRSVAGVTPSTRQPVPKTVFAVGLYGTGANPE